MTSDIMQFLLYLTVSSVAASVNLLVGFTFYSLLGLSAGLLYSLSVAIGYLAGGGVNWSLNRLITFPQSGRPVVSELRTFVIIASIGLLLTTVLAAVFRAAVAVYASENTARFDGGYVPSIDVMAHAAAIAVVAVYSFLGHRGCTFDRGIRSYLSHLIRRTDQRNSSSTLTQRVDKAIRK